MKQQLWYPVAVALVAVAASTGGLHAQGRTSGPAGGKVQKMEYGTTADGQRVELYTLTNSHGLVAKMITYGALVTEMRVPDSHGRLSDVVLGFNDLGQYLTNPPYFGATIGRVANRIGKGRFALDGHQYVVATNNGPNHLHGGVKGFDKRVWTAEPVAGSASVKFTYVSPDAEEGYPGTLTATVTYVLTDDNELKVEYAAATTKPTPVNLTNHSYFNLAGEGHGDILGHRLMIAADAFTPVDDTLIPTGEIKPVKGTAWDFTTPTSIGARIDTVPGPPPGGYDHNYVLRNGGRTSALAARVEEPTTGRVMEVWTDQPGVQFYSGNFLDGTLKGKSGVPYKKHDGFCLETQHFPDSVNHPNFPSVILRPGQTYHTVTAYIFKTSATK